MNLYSSYKVKIKNYSHIFGPTILMYRKAVDFFIDICIREWDRLKDQKGNRRNNELEKLTVCTAKRPEVPYPFHHGFYKFPSYLRRAAMKEAGGKVSSYMSLVENWDREGRHGRKPGYPCAGRAFPVLYKGNMYEEITSDRVRIKVYIRNTWDWMEVELKRTDVDYIIRHCAGRRKCSPTLEKKGKEWFLVFSFEEEVRLQKKSIWEQKVLAVDLGINHACVCTVMDAEGTVAGREFLRLPAEKDSLKHAVGRIKKAQQHGAGKTPGLWAAARGINHRIAVVTASFIMEQAVRYGADVIVFEHLERKGKKKGSKKQKLHLWKAQAVWKMVTDKAHRLGKRVQRVNAWNTSRLAFDGSGQVERGIKDNYSICRFPSGKEYHCDLNAAYNIGARYIIREILREMSETTRLGIVAKVPECTRRSTCTLSTLYSLHAALVS